MQEKGSLFFLYTIVILAFNSINNRLIITTTPLEEIMKTFLTIAAFLISTPLISMDKLADEQSAEIENRIKQLEFAMNNGSFFAGREESRRSFINDQITIIEKILTANSIPHPEKKLLVG